jgi:hypothetical protein
MHHRSHERGWTDLLHLSDTKLHGLAQAAAEYHRVAAENRELYNQVQDLKGKFWYTKFLYGFLLWKNATGQKENSCMSMQAILGCTAGSDHFYPEKPTIKAQWTSLVRKDP